MSYISASTNRHPCAADISGASLVAFASSTLVALWDTASDRGVFDTLAAHEGLVTCVRFVTDDLLATADDKGELRCWRRNGSQWKSTAKTKAHAQAISSLCAYNECLATGASDGTVKIWKIASDSDELEQTQILSLNGKYPLALAMTVLPQSKVEILAVAGTDRNVQIWTRSGDSFLRSAVLSGHEDWVRSLAFQEPAASEDTLTLASGSQDATIRLWKIEAFKKQNTSLDSGPSGPLSDDLLDAFEASLGDLADAEEGGRQISLKRHILTVKSDQASPAQYSITFDALLVGHEAGLTSLSWRPSPSTSTPTLLSTSTDSSLILWSPTEIRSSSKEGSTSIWISRQRFGDVGGQRLGGFVGGLWARGGDEALAWGWSGGWRRWRCTSTSDKRSDEVWAESSAITGHNGPVKDLDWSPTGEYLISAGLDQTTRVHAPIRGSDGLSWRELSRPQVHGYDMLGAVFLGPLKFVSIADEKVARVFEAPRGFVNLAEKLGVATFTEEQHIRPVAASVPPLGLSNKAVNEAVVPVGESDVPSRPPFEGELAATTLWPETEKIFGHGYESMSLAVSRSRQLIATACKASTAEHAVVRVYDTDKWQPVGQPLAGHTLTVTRIAFSPDDRLVLSVSRDRSWRLYEVQDDSAYLPIAADKSHGRIIWDCAWASEGDIFATASRDKTVKIWERGPEGKWTAAEVIKLKEAATAVDFSPLDSQDRRLLAIGLETGVILVYSNAGTVSTNWQLQQTFDSSNAHVGHVHRLSWRPTSQEGPKELASCSEDGTLIVRVVMSERRPNN
ncbi:WD40-repeat-containing domain protein [Mycena albidolilacea]|uniref:Elongator complex protein 2 n=1 Tax=Mycena albidolilacea TaxID=1033008 RepID=A0AAD7AUN0_9AGAR|nr:WD40-repeat-containing domain protein [Mycena albidolilacea]